MISYPLYCMHHQSFFTSLRLLLLLLPNLQMFQQKAGGLCEVKSIRVKRSRQAVGAIGVAQEFQF